jgi:hypothetical protein
MSFGAPLVWQAVAAATRRQTQARSDQWNWRKRMTDDLMRDSTDPNDAQFRLSYTEVAVTPGFRFVGVAFALLAAAVPQLLFAQEPSTIPAFEAAEVHVRARSSNPNPFMTGGVLRNGRYDLRNATMVDLIATAYNLNTEVVLGGPSWLERARRCRPAPCRSSTP